MQADFFPFCYFYDFSRGYDLLILAFVYTQMYSYIYIDDL